jgi:hypothetical protein
VCSRRRWRLRALIGGGDADGTAGGSFARDDGSTLRELRVSAGDRAALLATWLDELVLLAETEDLVPAA